MAKQDQLERSAPQGASDDDCHRLWRGTLEQARTFEKCLLTLAAGGLAVSILFIKEIGPKLAKSSIWALVTAWCLLLSCVLATLVSLLTTQIASRQACLAADEPGPGSTPARLPGQGAVLFATILNWVALSVFVVGAVFLVIFASLNIPS